MRYLDLNVVGSWVLSCLLSLHLLFVRLPITSNMYMKPTLLTAAAALSAGVAADFLVITDYPQALQTLSPAQVS